MYGIKFIYQERNYFIVLQTQHFNLFLDLCDKQNHSSIDWVVELVAKTQKSSKQTTERKWAEHAQPQ